MCNLKALFHRNDSTLGCEILHGRVSNLQVGTEAAFHGVEEYMKYVEEYYQELEVRQGYPVETKRVYVATDEPKVSVEVTTYSVYTGLLFFKNYFYS